MKKSFTFIAIILLLLMLLCSCSSKGLKGKGYNTNTIRLMTGITYASAVQQIMQIDELLEKSLPEGVTANWSYTGPTSADCRDALIAGKIDIGAISIGTYITAVENGMPFVILSGTLPNPVALYSTRETINSFEDIKAEHTIGMPGKGSNFEIIFSLRCKEVFGEAAKFSGNIVPMSDADMLTLIQGADSYDLYNVGFPTMQKISGLGNAKLIDDLVVTAAKYNIGLVFVTTEDFYKNNPVLVDAFRTAADQAIRSMKENAKETAEKLSEYYQGVTAEEVASLLDRCQPNPNITNYDDVADILYEMGILAKPAKKFTDIPHYEDIPKG